MALDNPATPFAEEVEDDVTDLPDSEAAEPLLPFAARPGAELLAAAAVLPPLPSVNLPRADRTESEI